MSDPRRVGTVVIAHPDAELSALGLMAVEAIAGLCERGWRVVLAVPSAGPLISAARDAGATAAVLPAPVLRAGLLRSATPSGRLVRRAGGAARVVGLLRRERPDVVYIDSVRSPIWATTARLLRLPVVTHVHDHGAHRASIAQLARSTRILVSSEHGRTDLLAIAPALPARPTVLHDGVRGPDALIPPRERVDGPFRLLYADRVSHEGGIDVAVEAVGLLVADGMDLRLEVADDAFGDVGDRFRDGLHRRITALGLTHRVRFTGPRAAVWPLLVAADAVVVPSRRGAQLSTTALQAVLAARPVAVSTAGGVAAALDGFASAVRVPPEDPAALAGAVRRIATSWSAFRRTAIAVAPIAAEQFGPERFREAVATELLRAIAAVPEPVPMR